MFLELTAFHIGILVAAAGILIAAALIDAQRYRIPNIFSLVLLCLFPLLVLTAPRAIDWQQNVMIFGLMMITGFAMFLARIVGAGDIKLLSAIGLWAGPNLVAVLLIVTMIAGGILAVVMAILTRLRASSSRHSMALTKIPVPYGVAIACGGLCTLAMIAQPILIPR